MEGVLNIRQTSKIRLIVFDLIALITIYLIPTLSHLFSFPIYYLDPMRLMVFLVIIHTEKKNAYLIAATLPLVSYFTSSHPVLIKSLSISVELILNVWLFYKLQNKLSNSFIVSAVSIFISKLAYYVIKYFMISVSLISVSIISTPLYFQLITLIIISIYSFIVIPLRTQSKK